MQPWITREIMSHILKAIHARDDSTHVFYITAQGGMGKTILLRQVGMRLGSPDGMVASPPWSGILDLYHAYASTNSGLEERLSQALEKDNEFQAYWAERDVYKARREAGEYGGELEEERQRLAEVFAGCVNKAAQKDRLVVAFDTTERIQFEADRVQELCGLESESATVKAWLLDQLKRWGNCVVLLAGRLDQDLQEALAEDLKSSKVHYHQLDLPGFTEHEAAEYFAQQSEQYPELKDLLVDLGHSDLRRRLLQITGGKPIRLDLALWMAQYELGLDRLEQIIQAPSSEQAQEEIDRLLIEHMMQDEPDTALRIVLRYLAVARKGLDVDLLCHLEPEWTREECQRQLDALVGRPFIKQRSEDGRLFLHDAMYELCDAYLLPAPEVQKLSRSLKEWYDEQLNMVKDGKTSKDVEKRRNYQVDSLLYRLRANPREGYYYYAMLVDEAIRYAEIGFDMQMRNELLAFTNSRSPIDRRIMSNAPRLSEEIDFDCAARWVKRYLFRDDYKNAIRIAEAVKKEGDGFYPPAIPASQLSRADLDVYYAQAMIYTGSTEDAIALLQQVISELEGEHQPEELARGGDPHAFAGWRRNLVLGRGHNNVGYAYGINQGHCRWALREYRAAVLYFRASDLHEEYANTLDNMGRIYTTLYERGRAESLIDDSLALRRKLGHDYRTALSVNSRAVCHVAFDEPHRARRLAEEALGIFEQLGSQRGIGVVSLTLGSALRKLGGLDIYPPDERDRLFRDAIMVLERAINIYEKKVKQPRNLIMAYNELGCTYRDRADLVRRGKPGSPLAQSLLRDAVKYLEKSIELAEKHTRPILYADGCEDLAQVFVQQQDYRYARVWLKNAEDKIPEVYRFKPNISPSKIEMEDEVEEFWQMLGKIELLRGFIAYSTELGDDGKVSRHGLEHSMEHFALAYAYFERYSERSVRLEITAKRLYELFKKCKYDDLRHLREVSLPHIAERYCLNKEDLTQFFKDTLGLVLQFEDS